MKTESDRILRRPVLSVLVAAALYTPQVMAFTKTVNGGDTAKDELVENGVQNVYGEINNITVDVNGWQYVYDGGTTTGTSIKKGEMQIV